MGDNILLSIGVAMGDWHANVVRLPLSQDRWFGHALEQKDGGKAYRDLVVAAVAEISTRGGYALLDLHWSNMGEWASTSVNTKCPTPKIASSGRTPRRCSRTTRP